MLKTSVSPHIHSKESIQRSMWNVNIALMPALAASVYFFGPRAFWLTIISVLTALISEILIELLFKKEITIRDGSAVITGILVAFNMPPAVPFYIPVVGTFFAIVIVKHLFGGLGNNIFNPALAGRVFVMFAWLPEMTTWNLPLDPSWLNSFNLFSFNIDSVTAATPLAINKAGNLHHLIETLGARQMAAQVSNNTEILKNLLMPQGKFSLYKELFIGNVAGSIGETSVLAILIGALYMLGRRIIKFTIPFFYILIVFGITALAGQDPLFHILAGGLFLGAFFMATDYVTGPFTFKGALIYAAGCGLLTSLLRLMGGLPEGVSFSILIMNALTPLIDRYTKTKVYGKEKK